MTIVLATDSFKGCLTSQEVEAALAVVLRAKGKQVLCLPMSDGGDGMLDAFSQAMKGELREAVVHDPLMRIVKARYAVCPNGTAIIESAQACGLHLMSKDERNPLKATTYGVGELLLAAMNEGCRDFIIGLGGSGTSDCGRGMLMALAQKLTCGQLEALPAHPMIRSCRFILASDVQNHCTVLWVPPASMAARRVLRQSCRRSSTGRQWTLLRNLPSSLAMTRAFLLAQEPLADWVMPFCNTWEPQRNRVPTFCCRASSLPHSSKEPI